MNADTEYGRRAVPTMEPYRSKYFYTPEDLDQALLDATKAREYMLAAAGSAESAETQAEQSASAAALAQAAQAAAEAAQRLAQTAQGLAETAKSQADAAALAALDLAEAAAGSASQAGAAKTAAETAKAGAETARDGAENAQTAAQTAKTQAETAKAGAEEARDGAETAQTAAEAAQTGAEAAKTDAESAKTAAETAREGAESAQTAAETAKTDAQSAQTGAEAAQAAAEAAQTGAESAQANAETAQTQAAQSAEEAEAARQAIEDMEVTAETVAPGQPAEAIKQIDPETGAVTVALKIPQGERGDPGEAGQIPDTEKFAKVDEENVFTSSQEFRADNTNDDFSSAVVIAQPTPQIAFVPSDEVTDEGYLRYGARGFAVQKYDGSNQLVPAQMIVATPEHDDAAVNVEYLNQKLDQVNEYVDEQIANNPGPQGPVGPQGPQGPAGATGPQGPAGSPAYAKRSARFTVGTSTAGWTANDCDYLCDGTADQEEINAAIQALPSGGGEVVILDGTYNLTGSILVNKSKVTLSGNGQSTVLKRAFAGTSTQRGLIYVKSSYNTIRFLALDGQKSTYSGNYNYGIYLNSSSSNTITGNTCNNNYNHDIYLYSSSNNNTITGNTCNNNSNYGIYLNSSSSNTIIGNTCNNNSSTGIRLTSSSNNTVTGNTCIRGTGTASDYTSS